MVIVIKITEKEVLNAIKTLEIRVDELIQKCDQFNTENQSLKENYENLSKSRESLLEKNNLAKSKAESILDRLKHVGDSA